MRVQCFGQQRGHYWRGWRIQRIIKQKEMCIQNIYAMVLLRVHSMPDSKPKLHKNARKSCHLHTRLYNCQTLDYHLAQCPQWFPFSQMGEHHQRKGC